MGRNTNLSLHLCILIITSSLLIGCPEKKGDKKDTDTSTDTSSEVVENQGDSSQTYQLTLSSTQTEVSATDMVIAKVGTQPQSALDYSSVKLYVDLGQGVTAKVPFENLGDGNIEFASPLGVFLNQELVFQTGVAKYYLKPDDDSKSFVQSELLEVRVNILEIAGYEAGTLTQAYLGALAKLAERSMGDYASLDDATDTITREIAENFIQRLGLQLDFIDLLNFAIQLAQNGESVEIGHVNGESIYLTQNSLAYLDQYFFSFFRIVPKSASNRRGANQSSSHQREDSIAIVSDFDVEDIADQISDSLRDSVKRFRAPIVYGLGIAAGIATISGAPVIAATAGTLAAFTWFTTGTAVSTITAALEGGSSAIANGESSYNDFTDSAAFALDSYLDPALGLLGEAGISEIFGAAFGAQVGVGVDVLEIFNNLENEVDQGFANNDIPANGLAASEFSLQVSVAPANDPRFYQIEISTIPSVPRATVALRISGSDGYYFEDQVVINNGVVSLTQERGTLGERDTIVVTDINGDASDTTYEIHD